uniref:Uncharacterized protein n=1 Tax=Anguilla anguilla TaxID=7936 RepID=A0A0E9Q8Z4_ANGAN
MGAGLTVDTGTSCSSAAQIHCPLISCV